MKKQKDVQQTPDEKAIKAGQKSNGTPDEKAINKHRTELLDPSCVCLYHRCNTFLAENKYVKREKPCRRHRKRTPSLFSQIV